MSDDQALTGPGTQTRRALLAGAGRSARPSCWLPAAATTRHGSGGRTRPAAAPPCPAPATPAAATGRTPSRWPRTADIPVGGGKVFAAEGVVITQPRAGQFKGFSPICTHQGCPVSNVDGGTINCTCHGSKFSIEDGSVKAGPATKPLPPKDIKVNGDQISLA